MAHRRFSKGAGLTQRHHLTEIGVRDLRAAELPREPDVHNRLALWNAPGL